ncbi:MAG: PilZ domain-containing protein [Myxococcales bacterium]|nr:PilZ domain-containing protein [Myxococcales bacterium]
MALTLESPPNAPTLLGLSRQRRSSARRPFNADVELVSPVAGGGVTLNASEGGLRVAVDCPLAAGEICLLYVREGGSPERLERARVAWSRELRDGWIAGLQLIGLH